MERTFSTFWLVLRAVGVIALMVVASIHASKACGGGQFSQMHAGAAVFMSLVDILGMISIAVDIVTNAIKTK